LVESNLSTSSISSNQLPESIQWPYKPVSTQLESCKQLSLTQARASYCPSPVPFLHTVPPRLQSMFAGPSNLSPLPRSYPQDLSSQPSG